MYALAKNIGQEIQPLRLYLKTASFDSWKPWNKRWILELVIFDTWPSRFVVRVACDFQSVFCFSPTVHYWKHLRSYATHLHIRQWRDPSHPASCSHNLSNAHAGFDGIIPVIRNTSIQPWARTRFVCRRKESQWKKETHHQPFLRRCSDFHIATHLVRPEAMIPVRPPPSRPGP